MGVQFYKKAEGGGQKAEGRQTYSLLPSAYSRKWAEGGGGFPFSQPPIAFF